VLKTENEVDIDNNSKIALIFGRDISELNVFGWVDVIKRLKRAHCREFASECKVFKKDGGRGRLGEEQYREVLYKVEVWKGSSCKYIEVNKGLVIG